MWQLAGVCAEIVRKRQVLEKEAQRQSTDEGIVDEAEKLLQVLFVRRHDNDHIIVIVVLQQLDVDAAVFDLQGAKY